MASENHCPIRLIDIAHRAHVSYTAVAHVLRGSAGTRTKVSQTTANHIRRVAAELGYVSSEAARPLVDDAEAAG